MPTFFSSDSPDTLRIKFVWGSTKAVEAQWRLGLFGFYTRVQGYPDSGLAISVRGLLRWSLILGLAGYIGGAAVVTRLFARAPHNQIGFADVLTWPVRRQHMAELRGRSWIARGLDELKARHWREGELLLRRGLGTCPDDNEGRFALAQFYLVTGRRAQAVELLTKAAQHGLPPASWRDQTLALTTTGGDWSSTLRFCDGCLNRMDDPAQWAERQPLLAHKMAALIKLDRAAEALELATADGDMAGVAVKTERVRALLALGRPDEAAELLAHWQASAVPALLPRILQLRAQALREAGRSDEMETVLAELRALHPARPEPQAFAVEQHARAGRGGAAALEDFIFRFGASAANLMLVVRPLAQIPDVPLVQRTIAAATQQGFSLRPFQVQLAEALLRQGDWSGLSAVVAELAPQMGSLDRDSQVWFEWIQSLSGALNSTTPLAQRRLVEVFQARLLGLESQHLTVDALQRAGRNETARDVLGVALKLYPESPRLMAGKSRVEAAIAATTPLPGPGMSPIIAAESANWSAAGSKADATAGSQDWTGGTGFTSNPYSSSNGGQSEKGLTFADEQPLLGPSSGDPGTSGKNQEWQEQGGK